MRFSGMSYAEIAETLEVSVGSVGTILARAEKAFRNVYVAEMDSKGGSHDE
jgi:DNA-directed RNA polymerase specialized sigma24 family protein